VSPEGAHGMLTGVLETVHDRYEGAYYSMSPNRDPQGPSVSANGLYVARGNWHADVASLQHVSFNGMEHPLPAWIRTHWGGYNTGLRCARTDSKSHVTAEFYRERQRLLRGGQGQP